MGSPRNSFMRLEAFEPWDGRTRDCGNAGDCFSLSVSLGVLVGPMLSPASLDWGYLVFLGGTLTVCICTGLSNCGLSTSASD